MSPIFGNKIKKKKKKMQKIQRHVERSLAQAGRPGPTSNTSDLRTCP